MDIDKKDLNKPTYSLIIGLYNHLEYLPKLVEALEAQQWRDFEVIFSDDGSKDGTKEWFEDKDFNFPWRYVYGKNKGLAHNINKGLKVAKGDYFVLIMGDSFPDTDYLMSLSYFLHPDFLVSGVRVQIDNNKAVDIDWRLKKNMIPQDNLIILNEPYNCLTGNGMMFSRELYEDIGGWDEKIKGYGGDDSEFIARAYYKGYICWSVVSATLYHHWHKAGDSVNTDYVNNKLLDYAYKR